MVTRDFNGDGLPDLAVVTYTSTTTTLTSTLNILLAQRDGTFVTAPGSPISFGSAQGDLATADFNGDGNLDIAWVGTTDLRILLGDGRGGFSLHASIGASSVGGPGMGGIATGDFNHDGRADLVITAYGDPYIAPGYTAVLLGDGKGNFTAAPGSPMQSQYYPGAVTVADFNMDGSPDLAIVSALLNRAGGGSDFVLVWLNDGTGAFYADPQGGFPTGLGANAIVQGDFNGDGKTDLATANWEAGTVTILLGDGTGNFVRPPDIDIAPATTSQAFISGYVPQWIAVGDVNGDGNQDLAVAVGHNQINSLAPYQQVDILLGDGLGGFQLPAGGIINLTSDPFVVTFGDFNGDGRLDFATANWGVTVSAFLGAAAPSSVQLSEPSSLTATVGVPSSYSAAVSSMGWDPPTGMVALQDGLATIGSGSLNGGAATLQATFRSAGVRMLVAAYQGDFRTAGSTSEPLSLNVAKGSQSITFPPVPNHRFGDAPFPVTATSSAGLPVTMSVVSGPATVASNVVTLTGAGTVTLEASQPGDADYLAAASVQQQFQVAAALLQVDTVLNAASYSAGSLAPNSFAVVFGAALASLATVTSGNLPTTLGGTAIQITDAAGNVANALLYYASPAQINLLLPGNLSPGKGTLTLQTQAGPSAMLSISIAAVAPGLFSADATGKGVAAGSALRVSADGTQTQLPIASCSGTPVVCTAVPIDLGSDSDATYLTLYGTGIRGRSELSAVTATIGGVAADVPYAGTQPEYPGLDQVNLKIDPALRGRGSVNVALTVDGVAANAVTVAIQ
ncbi:MAG TPA: FG-GAP-like repeat-containing protein [Bryobacteraceae bacterium]|nr:FG-GAP-like repeat-containing protein [Bryobacteraceae bacterium]